MFCSCKISTDSASRGPSAIAEPLVIHSCSETKVAVITAFMLLFTKSQFISPKGQSSKGSLTSGLVLTCEWVIDISGSFLT